MHSVSLHDIITTSIISGASHEVLTTLQGNRLVFEYTGSMNGLALHFFAVAMKKGNFVYLSTGTALESQWKNVASQMKKSLLSFVLK